MASSVARPTGWHDDLRWTLRLTYHPDGRGWLLAIPDALPWVRRRRWLWTEEVEEIRDRLGRSRRTPLPDHMEG